MPKKRTQKVTTSALPVDWHIPPEIVSRYATNLVVQHSENEFTLSFFETRPPFMLGTPDDIEKTLRETKAVKAECISRVVVAPGRMREFVEVLKANLERYDNKFKTPAGTDQ